MTASRQPTRTAATSGDSRGQSNPIGMVLVLGLVIAGASAIVVLGASAMEDTQGSLSEQRAEKVMTQLDSKSALVALGNTDTQRVALPRGGSGRYEVHEDAGWMNLTVKNETSGNVKSIVNHSLGEVVYENEDDTTIAYQGGGVWRSDQQGKSIMISPPEFHYRGATLTLPIVTVDGDSSLNSRARITNQRETKYFPNRSNDVDFSNPLDSGELNVTVQSDHYLGWGQYFERRTDGSVVYDHDKRVVTAELRVPFDEKFNNAVASIQANGITVNGNGDQPEPSETGVRYPPVDDRIEDEIDDCTPSGCTDLDPSTTINDDDTYYTDDASDTSGWSVNNPGGNVSIVVNSSFDPKDIEITNLADPYTVTVYTRGEVSVKDDVNEDAGDAGDLKVLVHSDHDVSFKGQANFTGLMYAPRSECSFEGGGANSPNTQGGVICETVTINGNPNDLVYDENVENTGLGLNPEGQTYITYLHVTVNGVTIESD